MQYYDSSLNLQISCRHIEDGKVPVETCTDSDGNQKYKAYYSYDFGKLFFYPPNADNP